MFEFVCIFTTGGIVLWSKSFYDFKLDFMNLFIKNILLTDKVNQPVYNFQDYAMKWQIQNDLKIIFAVVYKEILQLTFVDEFLQLLKSEFVNKVYPTLKREGDLLLTLPDMSFENHFLVIQSAWEDKVTQLSGPKKMRTFDQTRKGKRSKKNKSPIKDKKPAPGEDGAGGGDENEQDKIDDPQLQRTLTGREALMAKLNRNKKPKSYVEEKKVEELEPESKREVKVNRNWHVVKDKLNAKDMASIDVTGASTGDNAGHQINLEAEKEKYLGGDDDVLEGFFNSDEDVQINDNFTFGTNKKQESKSIFGRLSSAFQTYAGNKVLSEEEMVPFLEDFSQALMDKNVAKEVAESICSTVSKNLRDQRTQRFTTVRATIKASMEESIQRLLTPKRNIDILKEALSAKKRGQVFSIAFIGVNGVGKSTSLAKTAYYLKTKGNLKVMLAGCDNFRSGAIEQLATHAACLDLPLYEKGYKDDPAVIAKEALADAKARNYDVVLIDTAGRMQGNEKLMRALAKLVHINNPDVVLFVGEALVGNDAIDQLTKFNQSLIDFAANVNNPRTIDGIIMTKFDTVDEKVGTALNMVYTTGKPIVFVGVGQKYPHLKKLNVQTVLNALMNN